MQTLARRLKFYVLLVVACAAFLAACELGLRWMLPDDVPSTADYEMLEPDDVLGYRLGPSIDAVFERTPANGGDRIRWRTNARGFRGDELAATNMTRIVLYGDSNVQAVFSTELARGASSALCSSAFDHESGAEGFIRNRFAT